MLIISLLFFLGLSACEDKVSCFSNNSNLMSIRFYKIDTLPKSTELPVNIRNVRTQEGKLVYTSDEPVTSLSLPLNPAAGQGNFIFEQDTASDTLQLTYDREQQLISPECGVDQRFYNLNVAQHTFDSIRARQRELDKTPNTANLAIYFCQYEFIDTVAFNFYTTDTLNKIKTDTANLVSVTDARGNIIVANEKKVSLKAPLGPNASQATLFFTRLMTDSTVRYDTLILYYRPRTFQIAKCQPQLRYDLDSAGYTFDSLSFIYRTLDLNHAENIRIFY